ncbi:MMPL family protein [uncultured Woeseiaceae bacterium]|uniref:MMPL family protein n=1 Tax=uncultured Woeseiaceae bacterium TaxID=1983305 RepID=A0A7D9H5K4_9GAMM|nr:MMPL family protein [uncultured Woeseiaceae bacterium]
MPNSFQIIDRFAARFTRVVLRFRWLVILAAIVAAVTIGSGARNLEFANNYRVFFSDENPELVAFENLQATYTKNDNFLFVLEPANGDAFSSDTLAAVEILTEAAWRIPYAIRVDSISNFQHTYGIEDDLIVEDLFRDSSGMDADERARRGAIAIAEPLLENQLVTSDGTVTAVNVVLQYPEKSLVEVPEAVEFARGLRRQIESAHPDINVSLTGVSMLNNAFAETGVSDVGTLMPIMFGVILLLTLLILRSAVAALAAFGVIILSTMVGMGWAGFVGIDLTPISASAPTIILTLAIADSMHILIALRSAMRKGAAKTEAIVDAVRLNFLPVGVTSITTIVGFLALNFSDSPPFWHLGNITAVGIGAAWLFSITLLPALISVLPYKVKQTGTTDRGERAMARVADFVIGNPRRILLALGSTTLLLTALIPTIDFNDQWTQYFDERVEFRRDTDQALQHLGMYPIEYSVPARESGGISEPEYLAKLEDFAEFLRAQPEVVHVYSFSDIMKRLNKNLHGDDQSFYVTPAERDEAAQFLLLYELSLPYGLDLNDRINIDKSATRVTATLGDVDSIQTKRLLEATEVWMQDNLPDWMQTKPTSAQVMFTYIAERNVENMVSGTIIAIGAIALILMLALQSFRLGLLSLIPNGLPILATFGAWALIVGEVGFSVATIASISLGIIVDDTVHLLSKYVRARRESNSNAADAIRYAFKTVGVAIVVNTVVLTAGFMVMLTSSFKVNVDMGLLTAIAIVFALILDFLFLPALLLLLDRVQTNKETSGVPEMKSSIALPRPAATAGLVILVGMAAALASSPGFGSSSITPVRGETEAQRTGFEIAARADRSDRGFINSEVELEMVLRNAAGKESHRTLKITTLEIEDESVGDKTLVVFDNPRDIKGTALLSHANILDPDDQWLFLPALKRVKRISSANKSGPFVGSEFAFEDFTALELNKFDYTYLREEDLDNVNMDVIERTPRYEKSGYTRQVSWVDRDIYQVRKVEFYDRRGDLLKTLTLKDYRNYDGVWRSQRMEMVNHQTGKSTDFIYGDYQFDIGLEEGDFVKSRLTRLR